ncbi:hypothetical protein L1049_013010 [Liquidambar formosana]|uniref:NAD(P)H-quinone oxidoreductase subunit N, chloroplastic n=1 Tax=Liquidambar formosana TaxID=63359 RepID=A0AAP0RNP1_LIQFO
MAAIACLYSGAPASINLGQKQQPPKQCMLRKRDTMMTRGRYGKASPRDERTVEEHKALAIYSPHEGGYEGRYLNRLRYQGYYFLDLSARGLGDPETTLTKIHPVCPAHVGKQPIARWYFPPEVDYRLSLLPPNAKGLVVWIIEAKVLSKSELQFLALLPTLRPKVRVIAECGNWRKFMWKPLKDIVGLTASEAA